MTFWVHYCFLFFAYFCARSCVLVVCSNAGRTRSSGRSARAWVPPAVSKNCRRVHHGRGKRTAVYRDSQPLRLLLRGREPGGTVEIWTVPIEPNEWVFWVFFSCLIAQFSSCYWVDQRKSHARLLYFTVVAWFLFSSIMGIVKATRTKVGNVRWK